MQVNYMQKLYFQKSEEQVWGIMGDLMDTLQVANLRIYNGVIRKIRGLRCYLHVTNKPKILWTKRNPKTFAALGLSLVETTGLELLIDLFLCCLCMFFCTNSANLGGFLYQIALPSTLGYPWLKGKIRVTASSCHEATGSVLI